MGWALTNLSADARERIARSLFEANDDLDKVDGDLWLNGKCPLHSDGNPSFGYNITKDYFHCLVACTANSDLLDLWFLVNGYPAQSQEGMKAFKKAHAGEIGLGAPKRKTPGQLQPKPKKEPEKPRKALPEEVYTVQGPIPPAMLDELRVRRGWSREVIEELGIRLLTHYRKSTSLYKTFALPEQEKPRVAIPIRDEKGILWNIRTYYPFGVPKPPENDPAGAALTPQADGEEVPQKKPGFPKIMAWGKGHGNSRLFPSPAFWRPGPVLGCEGEPDTLCARSLGLNGFTQTSKTTGWPDDQLKALAGRVLFLAYDADKPGQEYAQSAAKSAHAAGIEVRIIQWPDYMGRLPNGEWPDDHGQDLTDFFVKHHKTVEDFQVLMDKAPVYDPLAALRETAGDDADCSGLQFFRSSVNGRVSFSERMLADYLVEKHPMLYHDKSGQLYRWEGSYYESWSEEQLYRAGVEALGMEGSAARVSGACRIARAMVSMPHDRDLNDRPEWVCLQNGMFNLYTCELKPHSPDYMSTIKLNVSWHGNNAPKPGRFLSYLDQNVQTPGVIAQMQEYAGYSLTRETKFGKALLLLGPGADGKSKFIALLRAMVGPQNCSAVPMAALDDQFQRAALFGKILNVAGEVTTEAMQSDMFKAVVTGDPIQASFKHRDSFEFIPFAKLIYATNKMPRVLDNSDGYFRRILPVRFKKQYLEDSPDVDPDLEVKLMQELDGIFAWAVMGLHRLIGKIPHPDGSIRTGFTQCDETRDFMLQYRRYNNPVIAFVQDCCNIENTESKVELKLLYQRYKKYCTEGGYKALSRDNFFEEFQTAVRKLNEDAYVRKYNAREEGRRLYVMGVWLISEAAS